jgi:hypothetical protein
LADEPNFPIGSNMSKQNPEGYKSSVAQKLEGVQKQTTPKPQESKVFQPNVNVTRRPVTDTSALDKKLPKELLMAQQDKKPQFKPNMPKRRPQSFDRTHTTNFDMMEIEDDDIKPTKKTISSKSIKLDSVDVFEGLKMPPTQIPIQQEEDLKEESFLGSEIMQDDELFFIQLPSALPFTPKKPKTTSKQVHGAEFDEIWTTDFANTLTDLPKGHLGEMLVYKSGKMKLKLGGVLYDCLPGVNKSFVENVTSINSDTKQVHILGDVSKRILCVPDVEYLLKQKD